MGLTPAKDSIDIGILVRDIEKSLDFYEGLFALTRIEAVQTPFGMIYRLRYGTSDVKLLDSKTIPSVNPLGLRPPPAGDALTFLLTFEVQKLDPLCLTLRGKNVEFLLPETQIRPNTRVAMVKDPDGNVIELIERG